MKWWQVRKWSRREVITTGAASLLLSAAATSEAGSPKQISVKRFGALGDGSDATSAVLSAVSLANANPGSTIIFPKGVYLLNPGTYPFNLTASVTLLGQNGAVITSSQPNTLFTTRRPNATLGAPSVNVQDLEFRGAGMRSGDYAVFGRYDYNIPGYDEATDIHLRQFTATRVIVSKFASFTNFAKQPGHGVHADVVRLNECTFHDNHLTGTSGAVNALYVTRCAFRNNGLFETDDWRRTHGIYYNDAKRIRIIENVFDHNSGYGVHLYIEDETDQYHHRLQNVIFADNIFSNNGQPGVDGGGIAIGGTKPDGLVTSNVVIVNNQFYPVPPDHPEQAIKIIGAVDPLYMDENIITT